MTKKEFDDRERYPYLDPLPKYNYWQLAGGALLMLGMCALAYALLWLS